MRSLVKSFILLTICCVIPYIFLFYVVLNKYSSVPGETSEFLLPVLLFGGSIAVYGAGFIVYGYFTTQKTILKSYLDRLKEENLPNPELPEHEFEDVAHDFQRLVAAKRELASRLADLNTIDELTGTLNRSHLLHHLQSEMDKAQRYHTSFSVILLDIDGFSGVNDCYGVQIGNQVLSRLAAILINSLRSHDMVGRVGSDDFLLLLPLIEQRHARKVAERIRAAVEVSYWGIAELQVTVSGCVMQVGGTDLKNLQEQLDMLLLEAKNMGGNSICEPDESSEEPLSEKE